MNQHETADVASDTDGLDEGTVGPFVAIGIDGGEGLSPTRVGARATIRSHSILYRDVVVGDDFSTGHHVLVRQATRIGDRVSIGSSSVVEHHVLIEDDVRLHSQCFVPEHSILRAGCWLGPGVRLTNARYPNRPDTKDHLEGVIVGRGAVLGAGSVILPGVSVGEGAIVGAGAVVVADVQPGSTVVGNPARPIKEPS